MITEYGIKENGVDFITHENASSEVKEAVKKASTQIKDGTIKDIPTKLEN
jgi:basic membrane lipoprotein Med (substrate-binding protein (PBP1-ABC) superfamily)